MKTKNRMSVKRPIHAYVLMAIYIGTTTCAALINESVLGRVTRSTLALLSAGSMLNMIVRPKYIEVEGERILINRDFFRRQYIDIHKIEKIKFDSGPFNNSAFVLTDKTRIKFNDGHADDKELEEFREHFNLPFE